jgi:predicted nucleic acid-binding protein
MQEDELHAPHLIDVEVLSALRSSVRRQRLRAGDAFRALDTWTALGVRRWPSVGLLGRAWELRENCSAYDAAYVALAEAVGCPLVTADAKLARTPDLRCELVLVGE